MADKIQRSLYPGTSKCCHQVRCCCSEQGTECYFERAPMFRTLTTIPESEQLHIASTCTCASSTCTSPDRSALITKNLTYPEMSLPAPTIREYIRSLKTLPPGPYQYSPLISRTLTYPEISVPAPSIWEYLQYLRSGKDREVRAGQADSQTPRKHAVDSFDDTLFKTKNVSVSLEQPKEQTISVKKTKSGKYNVKTVLSSESASSERKEKTKEKKQKPKKGEEAVRTDGALL